MIRGPARSSNHTFISSVINTLLAIAARWPGAGIQNVEVFHVKHFADYIVRIYMCIHWPHIQQTKRVTAHWASVPKGTRAGGKLRAGGGAPGFSSLPTLNNIRSTSPQWAHPSEAWVGHPPVLGGVRVGQPPFILFNSTHRFYPYSHPLKPKNGLSGPPATRTLTDVTTL